MIVIVKKVRVLRQFSPFVYSRGICCVAIIILKRVFRGDECVFGVKASPWAFNVENRLVVNDESFPVICRFS